MKICIDPGHGAHDSGAVGPGGTLEKDLALDIGLEMKRILLIGGQQAKMTRAVDRFLTLSDRANLANSWPADLFVSIHCNAGGGIGFEAFTSPGQTKADPIATRLLEDYHEAFPDRPYRKDLGDGDPDKEARFTVLTKTSMPAVLFECGFIDHPHEEQWLKRNSDAIARTLANSIMDLARGVDKPEPDEPALKGIWSYVNSARLSAESALREIEKLRDR